MCAGSEWPGKYHMKQLCTMTENEKRAALKEALLNAQEMADSGNMQDVEKILLALALIGLLPKKASAPDVRRSYIGRHDLPLGIRHNNPGNLIGAGTKWKGLLEENEQPGIYTFTDWLHGTRALLKTLNTYINGHNLRTIRQIIARYAPAGHGGNDPETYARNVAAWTGYGPDQPLQWSFDTAARLAKAIFRQEHGQQYAQYLTDHDLKTAWQIM